MLGFSSALLSGANAIAPLLGGLIFQVFGPATPFWVGGFALALLLVVAIRTIKPGSEEALAVGLARSAGNH